jgi:hypothetical protein
MKQSPASIVYLRSWTLYIGGDIVYHARGSWAFPTYSAEPGSKFVQYRDGEERGETRCSRLIEKTVSKPEDGRRWDRPTEWRRPMIGVRLDIAEKIGRPCRQCWPGATLGE